MIFQNEKTPFQGIKKRIPKSRKIDIFPKGLTHGFGQKMAIFPTFFVLGNIGQESVFNDILERKKRLSKKWPFFQFFFQAIQARKMSFMIFQNEKTPFYAIKTRSSKSRKIDIFPKGLTHGFGPKMAIFPTFFFQAIWASKMSFMIFQSEKTPF